MFLPPGAGTIAFMKEFVERGLPQAGIKLIATGDITDEDLLDGFGDSALGIVTAVPLFPCAQSPMNKAYVAAYEKAYPKTGRTSCRSAAMTACS